MHHPLDSHFQPVAREIETVGLLSAKSHRHASRKLTAQPNELGENISTITENQYKARP